jgi:tripartite-type tricarboxylate transporter receptor subunit TctC
MKQTILSCIFLIASTFAWATENIVVMSPYSASHSGTPAMFKIINEANSQQKDYNFILEFRPGGEQIIAVNALKEQPNSRLAIIAPKFVEHVKAGRLSKNDYIPIHALGDACWAVITNVGNSQQGVASLAQVREIVVGSVGIGNATHLTALQIGSRYNVPVQFIPFKSNNDALMSIIGGHGVNFGLERARIVEQFKEKNSNLKILGMSCPVRHPEYPDIPTLVEQKIQTPYVFNIIVAHTSMPDAKRRRLGEILNTATKSVGSKEIFKLSDMTPPVFSGQSVEDYFRVRFAFMDLQLEKFAREINNQ